jgi:dCTP deaminase
MILSDRELIDIQNQSTAKGLPFIEPFYEKQVRYREEEPKERVISYGVSSYGYDLRAGLKFKIFSNTHCGVVDPKDFDNRNFVDVELEKASDYILIPPNGFILTHSMEHIRMPRDVTGVVLGKSTIARSGLDTLCTPLEAGWEGHVTLEFSNTTPLPVKFYAGEGCCQVLFFRGGDCITSYADRGGKYMGQSADVILPRL